MEDLSLHCKKNLFGIFCNFHVKGFIDCVGGNVKSNVRCQVISMKKDRSIIQDSESCREFTQMVVPSTKIKHFSDEEIANYKKTNPFRNSISVNGIFNMYVIAVDGSKT